MKTQSLHGFKKNIAALLFTFVFVLSGACLLNVSGSEVYAAEYAELDSTTHDDYVVAKYTDAVTIQKYVGKKAPTLDGYLFAGWFTSPTCTAEEKIASYNQNITEYYAKFVPEDVLSIKVQVSNGDVNGDTTDVEKNMRFVSSVDTLNYRQIGFRMKYQDKSGTWNYKINTGEVVFERIVSASAGDEYKFSPKVVDTKSEYFMTATWKGEENTGITEDEFDINYCVKAYWDTFDGVRVYGPTRYVSVDDGLNSNIVNIPVENTEWNTETKLTTVSYVDSDGTEKSDATATVAYNDGQYAHLKINLGESVNRTQTLSSATKFTISDGTNDETPIYRNLYTAYTGAGSEDTSWYEVYKGTTDEYIIVTSAELYGMEYLANYNGGEELVTFGDQKIYVVADITVNEGSASVENGWVPKDSGAKVYPWYAARGFAGTFDGQGHTISGLKGASDTEGGNHYALGIGLFTETSGAIIKNLSIVNSYYTSNGNGTGGLVGQGSGTFTNIHTDVIINSTHQNTAGMVGKATGELTIENCWSNCTITTNKNYVGGIVAAGNAQTVAIRHCLNTGKITISSDSAENSAYAAGIIAKTGSGTNGSATGDFEISDCLNIGIIKTESATAVKTIGGLVGHTSGKNSDGEDTVVISNSYSAINYAEDGTTLLGTDSVVGSDYRSDKTEGEAWIYQDVYDMNAFSNTDLSFAGYDTEGYWAIRDNDTPMLVSFLDEDDDVIGLTGRSKTEFVIIDGIGYISVLSQLEDFRDQINGDLKFKEGEVALMTDDIAINEDADAAAWADDSATLPAPWVAINGFTGIFDGQGYTISGLYTNKHNSGTGLFTNVDGVTIRNLCIEESYIVASGTGGTAFVIGLGNGTLENIKVSGIINSTKNSVGGLVGCANGDVTITNCWTDCDITSSANYFGGMIGNYSTVDTAQIKLTHCLNSGDITGEGATSNQQMGGFIGRVASGTNTKWLGCLRMSDCLNTGKITSDYSTTYVGGLVGYAAGTYNDNDATIITNSYSAVEYDGDGKALGIEKIIGSDKGAIITSSNYVDSSNVLDVNSYYYTDLDLYSSSNPDAYWAAREKATPILVSFYEGTALNISDITDETMVLTNNKGYIANTEQLLGFAALVDAGKTNSSTIVTIVNDLDMHDDEGNKHAWTPIGAGGKYFTGIFDGGGHTISGLAISTTTNKGCGLFATAEGITVKSLSLTDSTVSAYDANGTGVIVGKGNGTFTNIYVDVTITTNNKNYIGGIIGNLITEGSTTEITSCWNNSALSGSGQYWGGMIGAASKTGQTITVAHCLNTGNLTYTGTGNSYHGGLVGRANTSAPTTGLLTIKDSLNVATVKGDTTEKYMGAILGSAPKPSTYFTSTVIENTFAAINYESGVQVGVKTIVGANSSYAELDDYSECMNYDELLGFDGYCNTTLDFASAGNTDGYWAAVEDSTPILSYFVTEDTETIDVSGLSKTEFNLVENVGLIWNADQLISFSEKMQLSEEERGFDVNSDTVVKLLNDINLNEGWKASSTAPDNVWVPIVNYVGTFDGQGYTISGIYGKNVSGIAGLGLFTQTTATTVIRNLNIANSYFVVTTNAGSGAVVGQGCGTFENISANATLTDSGARGRLAGILGVATGTTTIKNCWSDCTITTGGQNVGGILAFSNPLGQTITVTNCLNTGDLNYSGSSDSNSHFGGIVGRTASTSSSSWAGRLTIKNCLNTGYVAASKGYYGGILGYASGNVDGVATAVIENCYSALCFDNEGAVKGADSIVGQWGKEADKSEPNCAMVADYDLVGDLAYNYTGLDYWSSENTKAPWVIRENNTPMLATFVTETDVVLDPVAEGWTTFALADNAGTIANLYQLRSFASRMNAGDLDVNENTVITLTDDITVSGGNSANWANAKYMTQQSWTAINEFPGIFDGGNYTISGVYGVKETGIYGVGFFTDTAETTVIKNLKLTNSYFVSGDTNGTATIVGRGAGTLNNIYSDAIVVDNTAKGRAAGVVGIASGTLTITNCWNAGDVTATNLYVGGIVANANGQTVAITDCLNTGDVTLSSSAVMDNDTTNVQMGGIIGKTGSGSADAGWGGNITITNCLNVGTVKSEHATATDYIGSVVGYATGANTDAETEEVTYTVTIQNTYSSINYDENNEIVGTTVTIGSDKGASVTNCESIDCDLLVGEYGYYYLPFDFVTTENADGIWSARIDTYPVLSSFVSEIDTVLTAFDVNKTATTAASFYAANAYNTSGTATTSTTIGNDGLVVNIASSSVDEVTTYAEALAANGFIQYSERTIDTSLAGTDNTFYTFVGNGLHAYLSWYPAISTARLVLTPNETLPSLREVAVTENDSATPSVTQMQLDGLGMMYVVQLPNGEYIVIDGGTRTESGSDRIRLYNYLCDNVPNAGETPVIACWMFTHPDPDHIGNASSFLYYYHDNVEVKSFAYNFAGDTLVTAGGAENLESTETDANIIASISTLENRIASYYPGARTYNIHTGQTFSFKGVEIEILQTEEDFYPNTVTCWNDTCATWRMKFADGQTALFLGDSMTVLNTQLANTYGSYLKSDMLQLAHHGLYGGYQPLYEYVNPTVCFWPTTTANYESDIYRSLGYNNYLLTSGDRTFYWNAHMGTVLLEDSGVNPQDSYSKEVVIETE